MRRWILEWESQSLLPYVMQQLWETMEALKHLIHVGTSYSLGAYNLQGTQHSMRTGTCHLKQQQHLRVMTHINFCLHRNQHNTNKHVYTRTTYTHSKQKGGKQPVEGSTNKRYQPCTYSGLPPSKDE